MAHVQGLTEHLVKLLLTFKTIVTADLPAPVCGAEDVFFMGHGAALGLLESFARNASFHFIT